MNDFKKWFQYIHKIVKPPPLSISKIFLSPQKKILYPLSK